VEPETEKKKELEEFVERTEMFGEFWETLGNNGEKSWDELLSTRLIRTWRARKSFQFFRLGT
jgi:hypothetical protein